MGHLGSFGAALKELDPNVAKDTFDFFGETFTVVGVIPSMLMLQLGAATTGKIDDQEGLGAMWEAMRLSLTTPEHQDTEFPSGNVTVVPADEAQWVKFFRLAVTKNCDLEPLIELSMKLFEAQAGRPTEEPRGSLPGQSITSPSSSVSSSVHPAFAHLTPVQSVLAG